MDQFIKASTNWLRLSVGLLISVFALQAYSQCTDNGDGTFTTRDGNVWQKCGFGETFNKDSGTCLGSKKNATWVESILGAKNDRYLGQADWQVPSWVDYEAAFFDGRCDIHRSISRYKSPANNTVSITGNWWTSNLVDGKAKVVTENGYYGWEHLPLNTNSFSGHFKTHNMQVTFVRKPTGQSDETYKASLAVAENQMVALNKQQAIRVQEEREYIAKKEAEERQLRDVVNNKNPQTMYLAAGSYGRNGDSYKAKQVYEAIISRFPSSSWAVKANDQLNETKRSNDAESAASQRQYDAQRASRDADSRSKSQCSVRISQCENTCSGMKGDSWRRCNSGCQSLCSQF
jgi:hypothetical protein